jgi:predicted glycoside hydrolase/deacetylase ChbG (UPF0249 family)
VEPRTGRFHSTLGAFVGRLLSGRTSAREIEAEAAAQIAFLQSRGLRLTHLDMHKHTHMFPAVLRPVLRAARKAGIRALRNPFEPAWSRRATPSAPWVRRAEVQMLRLLEPAFRHTGTLDAATLTALLRKLPAGTWEVVTHPGYNDGDLAQAHTRLLASRERERQALRALEQFSGIELVSFVALEAPVGR